MTFSLFHPGLFPFDLLLVDSLRMPDLSLHRKKHKKQWKHFLLNLFPLCKNTTFAPMEEEAQLIYGKVLLLFMRNGIKSMTMDDISRELGISKKTLYKYVTDKNDLVMKLMEEGRKLDECFVKEVQAKGMNAIDENFEISRFFVERLNNVHPSIFYDLQKYHPKAWDAFTKHRNEFIVSSVENNLKHGIEEGLYRADLNIQIIRDIFISRINDIFENKYPSSKEYSFSEIYLESFRYHIRGVASEKGIQYLIEKVKKEKSYQQ
jgi:AcrR family transcriptional regulator